MGPLSIIEVTYNGSSKYIYCAVSFPALKYDKLNHHLYWSNGTQMRVKCILGTFVMDLYLFC